MLLKRYNLDNTPPFRRSIDLVARIIMVVVAFQITTLADTVTYRQIRQSGQTPQLQQSQKPGETQRPKAEESPTHPEFVRLPDGRIVKYGPGFICEEDCVDPMTPVAFRESGTRLWWIAPPLIAGGVICAILCRTGDEAPLTTPTVIIPDPSPSPMTSPTPPPTEIPEPGTIVLVGLGLGAMFAQKRRSNRRISSIKLTAIQRQGSRL